MKTRIEEDFQSEREALNEIVMQYGDLGIKRFFTIPHLRRAFRMWDELENAPTERDA